jgi:hypothetical protein
MERFVTIGLFLCIFFPQFSGAQEVKQETLIRFALWAQTEVYPGIEKQPADAGFEFPVSRIKDTASYLIEGMVYGWKFDYVPSDRARAVQEIFDITPVRPLSAGEKNEIKYLKPWIENDRLWCWIEFSRNDYLLRYYQSWQVVSVPRCSGIGYGALSDGFGGIQQAGIDAVKNGVREYQRKQIKNKPKEITGSVLIAGVPKIGIDAGRYVVTLDFFMETDKIIEYKKF